MAIGSEIRSQIRSLLTNGSEFGAWLRNSEPGGGSEPSSDWVEVETRLQFQLGQS